MVEVEEIAAKLSKRARRALPRIGADWTREEGDGPRGEDVYSLWWGRSNFGLVEQKFDPPALCMGSPFVWRLTALGKAVRAILQDQP